MALQSSGVAFRRILSHFPEEVSLAFAYGSGVYRQAGPNSDQKNAMLDFVFTVDDPVAWHSKNLKKNWSHYSFLKLLGPKMIFSVQNNYGAGVYYNPLILCDGRLVKYGVISTSTLIEDLLGWNNLYIAGRLQKPVKIVAMNEDATLRSALDKNLRSAVTAAFLMLPESFSEEELFMEIAGLSYAGDFRMVVGEEKAKVLNIVKPNVAHFRELYGDILQEDPQVVYKCQQGHLEIDKSPEGQFTQLMTLPKTLQQQINRIMDPPGKNRDVEETLLQVAHDPDCGDVVRLGLSAIVRPSSIRQSAKGILTAVTDQTQSQHRAAVLRLHAPSTLHLCAAPSAAGPITFLKFLLRHHQPIRVSDRPAPTSVTTWVDLILAQGKKNLTAFLWGQGLLNGFFESLQIFASRPRLCLSEIPLRNRAPAQPPG
ncbi:phosphatidate cytidylyltransferase, mitochondrial isoform X3 [Heterocephalus glaber]|uniref:Phosphatidate cytidylyltransferase, mitochondrial n=1 Tax=Heterocephalus glaber TaxID=10181 RepID=A0AAX6SCT1_HETGA|nr:phosphatidate cytidylyltransferase, mitochondrial isoform X3 [Heterocephalus glaber]